MADGRSADRRRRRTMIFGLFEPGKALHPLIDRLRKLGLPEETIEIASSLPLMAKPTRVGWRRLQLFHLTTIAGALGILFGILLAGGTAALYPLRTGGKPIVAIPVVGIISYEMMMLFAIVTTFVAALIQIVRSHRVRMPTDPRIDEGFFGISVWTDPNDPRNRSIERIFEEEGAVEVQRK